MASEGTIQLNLPLLPFQITSGMDLGLLTKAVFIDLRKAFDSVDHEILISKLESYGLKDIELDWFRN